MIKLRTLVNLLSVLAVVPIVLGHPADEDFATRQKYSWRDIANAIFPIIWRDPLGHYRTESSSFYHQHVASQAAGRYARNVVLRFNLTSNDQVLAIKEVANDLNLDIWDYTEDWVDIRVAKRTVSTTVFINSQCPLLIDIQVPDLLELLPDSLKTSYAPLIPDAAFISLIASSTSSGLSQTFDHKKPLHSEDTFFSDYQPLSVIYSWMKLLADLFPSHARLVVIGQTYEGRNILGIKVGSRRSEDDAPFNPRKTVLVIGGTHAREWISTSSVNYLAWKMITSFGKSELYTHMLTSSDWIFVPVMNPDGYEYSWTSDRLWRKNRQPTQLQFCHGIDLDHSYGFKFQKGESESPCSENYPGQTPWEAAESAQLRDWARNETQSGAKFIAFLDLHSYSQQILYPYSYSCNMEPPSLEDLEELALGMSKAMYHAPYSSLYRAGPACAGNVIIDSKGTKKVLPRFDSGGGSAIDWFYNELGVRYSYQIKLRDTGGYGFLLPKEQILPTAYELVAAAEWIGRFLRGEIGMASTTTTDTSGHITGTSIRGDRGQHHAPPQFQELLESKAAGSLEQHSRLLHSTRLELRRKRR